MSDEAIRRAYDEITVDEAVKERMLQNILRAASEHATAGKDRKMKRRTVRRILVAAAAVAVLTAFMAVAYASDFFGLWNVVLDNDGTGSNENIQDKREEDMAIQDIADNSWDSISLQGLAGSSEYMACGEWHEFYWSYDTDGAILSSIGNGPTGVPEEYGDYGCYTMEMADEMKRISEKYGLKLLGKASDATESAALFAAAGVGDVLGGAEAEKTAYSGYYYENGTFAFEGETTIDQDKAWWPYAINYQLRRTVKGYLDTVVLNIGSAEDYEQWHYTTENGVNVLLAISPYKALVIADREESFVTVNVLDPRWGDVVYGEVTMDRAALEAFAETFDFTAIP